MNHTKEEIESHNHALLNFLEMGALHKYSNHNLIYEVKKLINGNKPYLIEAYCISIQYTENIFGLYLDERDILNKSKDDKYLKQYWPIITALFLKKIISKDFYDTYNKAVDKRNEIVHSLTKKDEIIKKFNNKESRELPIKLMEMAKGFFIEYVSEEVHAERKLRDSVLSQLVNIAYANVNPTSSVKTPFDQDKIKSELIRLLWVGNGVKAISKENPSNAGGASKE